MKNYFRLGVCCATLIVLVSFPAASAPVFGEVYDLRQPDGTMVSVRIWSDEYYQVVESLDGYTLVRHPDTLEIHYAVLSQDGTELLPTPFSARDPLSQRANIPRRIRITPEARAEKVAAARASFAEASADLFRISGMRTSPSPTYTGNVQGITLLIDFPDEAGTILPGEVDDFLNLEGYTGFGNNGSVRDYFLDVSDGAIDYTNYVTTVYYTAQNSKAYYDDPNEPTGGPKAKELVLEALNWLESGGFDFSLYDSNADGYIDGLNCYYAGSTSSGFATGLWPHSSTVSFSADGVSANRYQFAGMGGSTLFLGVFCHENGHLLFWWPDLYDRGFESYGVGKYCLMANHGTLNPREPSAYLKYISGWTTVTILETPQSGLPITAGINSIYLYPHPNLANEYFLIENRQQSGRDAELPDAGLALWHIDTLGNNDNEQMTPESHYNVTLVQADDYWDLENLINRGDSTDLYDAGSFDEIAPETSPSTNWWDGTPSDLYIREISSLGETMTFDFGPHLSIDPKNDVSSIGPGRGWIPRWRAQGNRANPLPPCRIGELLP